MNKKGLAPLVLIPLIIVGVIVAIFAFRWIFDLVLETVLWLLGLAVLALAIFVVVYIVRWLLGKTKRRRRK